MDRRNFVSTLGALMLTEKTLPLQAAGQEAARPVIVEAGRRVDAPEAEVARFPARNVPRVREKIRKLLQSQKPGAVVSSAACGTDLLLLQAAAEMRIARYVLLPTAAEEFRLSSVTDRPGDWGKLYSEALRTSKVEVLSLPKGQQGYLETNLKLLDRAQDIARKQGTRAEAWVIWNQQSRGDDDVTEHFLKQARMRNMQVLEISTL